MLQSPPLYGLVNSEFEIVQLAIQDILPNIYRNGYVIINARGPAVWKLCT